MTDSSDAQISELQSRPQNQFLPQCGSCDVCSSDWFKTGMSKCTSRNYTNLHVPTVLTLCHRFCVVCRLQSSFIGPKAVGDSFVGKCLFEAEQSLHVMRTHDSVMLLLLLHTTMFLFHGLWLQWTSGATVVVAAYSYQPWHQRRGQRSRHVIDVLLLVP